MDKFTLIIEAVNRAKLPLNTRIFNLVEFDYWTWIHIPDNISNHVELYDICEVLPDGSTQSIDYEDKVLRECRRPWLQIKSDSLNKAIGTHTYQLKFVNVHTDDSIILYFAYTVQSDNPDKPYVYMNR